MCRPQPGVPQPGFRRPCLLHPFLCSWKWLPLTGSPASQQPFPCYFGVLKRSDWSSGWAGTYLAAQVGLELQIPTPLPPKGVEPPHQAVYVTFIVGDLSLYLGSSVISANIVAC